MSEHGDTPIKLADERRVELLEASIQVFARYGFRKASMDEVARAAGLSRQGLYLHFPSKEALFREVVGFLLERCLGAGRAALADSARSVEERLVAAFDAMYGQYVEGLGATPHVAELLETSAQLLSDLIKEQEQAFRDAVASAMEQAGVAAAWEAEGISASDLADTLDAVAHGLKHRVRSRDDYLLRVRKAVRIICGPGGASAKRRRTR